MAPTGRASKRMKELIFLHVQFLIGYYDQTLNQVNQPLVQKIIIDEDQ